MEISVIGMGYVGCSTAACLAAAGHEIIGVDINRDKVKALQKGQSPVQEPGLRDLLARMVTAGRLRVTTDIDSALYSSEVTLICVGTPGGSDGTPDLRYVRRICEEIKIPLKEKESYHTVILRSTVLPGTTENIVGTILERSGKKVGIDFGLAFNPEFLREGSALADFRNPPRTVIGEWNRRSGEAAATLFKDIEAPLVRTNIRTAEIIKYADNAFHALKIAFANELGKLCKAEGVDGYRVSDIFCLDTKLNLSSAYLKPGGAFGGSCLPKDLRAVVAHLRRRGVKTPVLESTLPSNDLQKCCVVDLISSIGKKRTGVLGLTIQVGNGRSSGEPCRGTCANASGK